MDDSRWKIGTKVYDVDGTYGVVTEINTNKYLVQWPDCPYPDNYTLSEINAFQNYFDYSQDGAELNGK